jgi:hypothetical protein
MWPAPPFFEQIHHVFKEFQVAALIAGDGDALGVFFDGGVDDLLHRAVVAQMDHLHAGALQNAPEDIDGGVVAVEKGCCRDDPHVVLGPVYLDFIVHASSVAPGCHLTNPSGLQHLRCHH